MTDLLLDTHIPKAFQNIGYSDYFTVTDTRQQVLQTVTSWRPTPERPNLLLHGKPGLGKTLLSVACLNERQRLWEFRTKKGDMLPQESLRVLRQSKFPVYFIQLAEYIDLHKQSFDLRDRDEEAWADLCALLDGLNNRARFLVIDDVGKEYSTASGFSIDTFDLLVRTRHNNGFSTIFTSNLPVSRWESCYSESMRNFIERTSRIVKFS